MNTLAIVAIVVGLLLFAGVAVATTVSADKTENSEQPPSIECKSCGNSCSLQRNCGLETCGAVNGGTCGCGR